MPSLFRRKAARAHTASIPPGSGRIAVPTYLVEGFPGAAPLAGMAPAPAAGGAAAAVSAAAPAAPAAPRFQYPLRFWVPLKATAYGLILLATLDLLSQVARVVALGTLSGYTGLLLIAGLAGVLFAVATGALIADVLPSVEIRPEGLAVTEFVRWRVIPWERITQIHSHSMPHERYVCFLQYAGTPLSPEHVVYALLAGLGFKAGIFYTSDIKGFDDVTRYILAARMRATPGLRVEDLLIENVPMPVVQMTFNPLGTLDELLPPSEPEHPLLSPATARKTVALWTPVLRAQAGLAAIPALIFLVESVLNGGIPGLSDAGWSLVGACVGLVAVGLIELPVVAMAAQALGESLLGRGDYRPVLTAYPALQLPRVAGFVAVLALVVIHAPFLLTFLVWLAALTWVAYLTLIFTERVYRIPQNQALIVAGVSAVAQIFVLFAYLLLRGPGLG